MAATADGHGYWLAQPTVVTASATPSTTEAWPARPYAPITHIVATPDGQGYWLVAADGGIFNFGDAGFYGSMGGQHLNAPVVDLAPTADGHGYWLVASDGGVFAFGDATSTARWAGSASTNRSWAWPPTTANGYWLVGRRRRDLLLRRPLLRVDRQLTSTSPSSGWPPPPAAAATGSWPPTAGSSPSATPPSTVAPEAMPSPRRSPAWPPTRPAGGYWLVAADGGIFTFGAPSGRSRLSSSG